MKGTTVKTIKNIWVDDRQEQRLLNDKQLSDKVGKLEEEFGQLVSLAPIMCSGNYLASAHYVSHYLAVFRKCE
jgi:hypothetical protein